MFLTQTYHLSTAGRVELELGINERPNAHVRCLWTVATVSEVFLPYISKTKRTILFIFQPRISSALHHHRALHYEIL